MGADLSDPSLRHANDPVALPHRRQSVRDDHDRSSFDDVAHVLLDRLFALVVQGACRLVEDQYARIGGEGTCDGDALPLSTGQIGPAFFDRCVVAHRQLHDELVRAGEPCHPHDLIPRHIGSCKGDVLVNCAAEQKVLLQYYAELAAQPEWIKLSDVVSVDEDLPGLRQIESLRQLGERRLAGA